MPDSLPVVNLINFNQDGTCISIGTSVGFKIFNCEPFGKFYSEDSGGYGMVEMLFSTSLLAIVGIGDQPAMSPRRLRIINTKKHSVICEVTFPTSILSVKMNRSRLVVLLKEQIYIYDISNMRLLHTIDTNPNPQGIVAMSPSTENCYLVYPSPPKVINSEIKQNVTTNNLNVTTGGNKLSDDVAQSVISQRAGGSSVDSNSIPVGNNILNSTKGGVMVPDKAQTAKNEHNSIMKNGDVILFNLKTLQPTMVIEAHKGEIAALALSFDGSLLATASEKGTIIRVFNVETGMKMYQFRRGTYPTRIHSMCFSSDNQFLAVTCSTKTIHIFKLRKDDIITEGHETHESDNSLIEDNGSDAVSTATRNADVSNDNVEADPETEAALIEAESNNMILLEKSKEPYVDASRRTVARMIRKSSQKLSRQAAKTLEQLLPIKVSSLLEPSRHFASLKLPIDNNAGVKSMTAIGELIDVDTSEYPELFELSDESSSVKSNKSASLVKMLPVRVITSDGYLYNYVLDPERGGDCLLLSQYSLLLA
ncbi:hypothetical protein HG536_0F02430 [Torulaspora globosa]|uniref:Autophagy-related protein 18 n=1 Tax=Torulaspora globosa TaxID=48254 RepID=A0A7G3ZK82_9SACH|nr:uncharacterized protein HG536_0F02430 [Torulaspora globosa]QLL33918.1 hypothetical protein HG536_0F02430 [Torulaspora globosa]